MRIFSARETEWLKELDGIELASFRQRAFAFILDWTFIVIVISLLATVVALGVFGTLRLSGHSTADIEQMMNRRDLNLFVGPEFNQTKNARTYHFRMGSQDTETQDTETKIDQGAAKADSSEPVHIVNDIVVPVLYFGILLWKGKGRTPGKRLMKIRVVSLMHRHITFWHAVERALGYGAAALEGGFGFVQFFIHPYRRCAQDRLAETIVVTERSYQALQHRLSHPLIPDTTP